jgi:hypothetical protein
MCSTLLLKRLTVVMTEPTSQYIVARIGAAAPDLESRLIQWASSSCEAHCIVRDDDGRVSLYLHRKESKTVRAMQSLIRTLTGRWGLHMGDLGKGWLELCTEQDYKAASSAARGVATAPCAPRVRVDPPHIEERATAPLWPCAETGVVLHALSPGFDTRSQDMYRQLLMRDQREPAPLAPPAH